MRHGLVEYAYGRRAGSPFTGLALQSGFSVRDCEVAAQTGRLSGIVEVARLAKAAEVRSRRDRPAGGVSGAVALARLQQMRGRLLDAELEAAWLL